MIVPCEEAAQILTRVLESLARASGKTLSARTRQDISRACELLAAAGPDLDACLDDLPHTTPGERVAAQEYADVPAEVEQWKKARGR